MNNRNDNLAANFSTPTALKAALVAEFGGNDSYGSYWTAGGTRVDVFMQRNRNEITWKIDGVVVTTWGDVVDAI